MVCVLHNTSFSASLSSGVCLAGMVDWTHTYCIRRERRGGEREEGEKEKRGRKRRGGEKERERGREGGGEREGETER